MKNPFATIRQEVPNGKLCLWFFHHKVVGGIGEVGQYDTVEQAQYAAGIGRGLIDWQQGSDSNHWTGWTDLDFHYTISPATKTIYRTPHEINEEQKRLAALSWRSNP